MTFRWKPEVAVEDPKPKPKPRKKQQPKARDEARDETGVRTGITEGKLEVRVGDGNGDGVGVGDWSRCSWMGWPPPGESGQSESHKSRQLEKKKNKQKT